MTDPYQTWLKLNRAYLSQHLQRVRKHLIDYSSQKQSNPDAGMQLDRKSVIQDMPSLESETPFALDNLQGIMHLSDFERDTLLLTAGVELDSDFSTLIRGIQGDTETSYPSFGLAMAIFNNTDWSISTPAAALRFWNLVIVQGEGAIANRQLQIDEGILNYLMGIPYLNSGFSTMKLVSSSHQLVASHLYLVEQMVWTWHGEKQQSQMILQLCGNELAVQTQIAYEACQQLGIQLYTLPANMLPTAHEDLTRFLHMWRRDDLLIRIALLIDTHDLATEEAQRRYAFQYIVENFEGMLILAAPKRHDIQKRLFLTIDVEMPSIREQRLYWEDALMGFHSDLIKLSKYLVYQFNLNVHKVDSIIAAAGGLIEQETDPQLMEAIIWDFCRSQTRPSLDTLAQRVVSTATWDSLILADEAIETLQTIIQELRQRARVYDDWGFGEQNSRGLGTSVLFAGASGTGKTLAAEVLANTLKLDLYRIDLSAVMSKYIGETEKNLSQIFDAAEGGGVVLLFDEADALFSKRSEVKDSHDRHANIEVSYLLQRLEAYRGIAILTTNLKDNLDKAFIRRLRFVVDFIFPDKNQRIRIWQTIFPQNAPTKDLDYELLANLHVSGGHIHNIALHSAFLAAHHNEAIQMRHILAAARIEYAKINRSLGTNEIKDWV